MRQRLCSARRWPPGQRAWGPDQTDEARIETNLGDLLAKRGRLQESERLLRAALHNREKMLPRNHPDIFDGEAKLGGVLVQEGRFSEAEPLLLRNCGTRLSEIHFGKEVELPGPKPPPSPQRIYGVGT